MTIIKTRVSTQTKRAKSTVFATSDKPNGAERPSPKQPVETVDASNEPHAARGTKHDRLLTLLSRSEGATVIEMMEASGWQQHSVRGFLAGTVKKKLGFILSSSKTAGELRRYRIDAKRGR